MDTQEPLDLKELMEPTAQLEDQELQVEQALLLDQLPMDQLDSQEAELAKHPEAQSMVHQEQPQFQQVELHMDSQDQAQALLFPHMVNQEPDTVLEISVNPQHPQSEGLELELEVEVELHTDNQAQPTVNQANFLEVEFHMDNQDQANFLEAVQLTLNLNQAQPNPQPVSHMVKVVAELGQDTQDNTEALELVELEQSVELLDHQLADFHQVIQA